MSTLITWVAGSVVFAAGLGATIGVTSMARPSTRVVIERYESGHVRRETTYRRDMLDGPSRGWYDNGARMFEYHYRNGESEGVQRQWYASGQSFALFHYHAGHEDGQQQLWNADGTIRSNYVIVNGRRFGLVGAMGCTGKGEPLPEDVR